MSVARSVTIVVGLLLLLTWLSWRAINPHAEQFDRALDELDHLGLVQDALYRDLLATRIGLLRNYDSLVSEMNALRYSVAHLQEIGSSDGQTGEAISRVRASIDREEQLVELFKRENAVLRNSLSFFARFETRSIRASLMLRSALLRQQFFILPWTHRLTLSLKRRCGSRISSAKRNEPDSLLQFSRY